MSETERACVTLRLEEPQRAHVRETVQNGAIEVWSRNGLPARERLLLDALPPRFDRALCVLDTRAVCALALRMRAPAGGLAPKHVCLDARYAALARRAIARHRRRVPVEVAADLGAVIEEGAAGADTGFDLVVLSAPAAWDLTCELIEQAHDVLRVGGRLLVGAERGSHELKARVKKTFGEAHVQRVLKRPVAACVVSARRRRTEARWRDRTRVVARELRGQQLELFARPGVLGAHALAPGVIALSEVMDVPLGGAVCELRCANGALGVTCLRLGAARAVFADTRARAIDLVERAVAHARLEGATTALVPHYDAARLPGRPFDLAVAALAPDVDLGCAGDIVRAAHDALREGGRLQITGRRPDELEALVQARFGDVERVEIDGHVVISGRRLAQLDG